MQRRKFLVGLGSLAAGASAAVGTGALSGIRADRGLRGQVVGDASAFLKINGSGNAANGFIVENESGEVVLDIDGDHSGQPQGDGLNPDSLNYFDDAFRLQNRGAEDIDVYIQESLSRIRFYRDGNPSNTFNAANAVTLVPFDGTNGSSATVKVGMVVDVRNITNPQGVFGQGTHEDEFTIVGERT